MAGRPPAPARKLAALPPPSRAVASPEDELAHEQQAQAVKLQPASFQGITPGSTKASELAQLVGEPLQETATDGGRTMHYRLGPFPLVEVYLTNDVVTSLVIHLAERITPAEMARELELTSFEAASVEDENGLVLGQVFPERGVMFSFAPQSQEPEVAQVLVDQVSAEPFLLRAEQQMEWKMAQALSDLSRALQLDQSDARIYWRQAQLLLQLDRSQQALTAAQRAVRLDGRTPAYRLCLARALAATGDHQQALELTRAVLEEQGVAGHVQAQAQKQLGDFLASGPQPDHAQAIEHHLAAIQLATPVAANRGGTTRRVAMRVLIEAHVAVAMDIAGGHWRKQDQVVPQWLNTASELAQGSVEHDQGPPWLDLYVQRHVLAASVTVGEMAAAADAAARDVERSATQLIDQTDDPLTQRHIERLVGQALLDALRSAHARHDYAQALRYGSAALNHLNGWMQQDDLAVPDEHLLANVLSAIGAVYGIGRNDHAVAVNWYERALPYYERALAEQLVEKAEHGDRLVSMGVSYWGHGDHEKGIQLTQQGVALLRQAVEDGTIELESLAIPYGNLASMYRRTGNDTQAQLFSDLAARLGSPAQATTSRRVISD